MRKNLIELPISLEAGRSYSFPKPVLLVGVLFSAQEDANISAPGVFTYSELIIAPTPPTPAGVVNGSILVGPPSGAPVYLNFQPDGIVIQNVTFNSVLAATLCTLFYKQMNELEDYAK